MAEEVRAKKREIKIKETQQNAIKCVLKHTYSLLYGGSRSGKTFIIMYLMFYYANRYPKSRYLICRFHFSEVKKSIIRETLPEVAELMGIKYTLNQADWFVLLPNGSEIWLTGVDDSRSMDRVLGKEYCWIWFNEASSISYSSYTTLITRLAQQIFRTDEKGKKIPAKDKDGKQLRNKDNSIKYEEVQNRVIIDENPPKKVHWTYKLFFDNIEPESRTLIPNPEDYDVLQMNPKDNEENISEAYIKRLESLPPKERKRFLLGEFADDISGALFTETQINQYRTLRHPDLIEIIVSIDPAVTAKSTSDETGIVVVGRDYEDRGYVLEDKSGIYTPSEWASIAVKLYEKWEATYILGEENQGGDMVLSTIYNEDKNVPAKLIRATKGKILRAEPISNLYEQGRISHVGAFPDLENEMIGYTGAEGEKSPNRLDALVHGFTALFPIGRSIDSEYFRDKLIQMTDEQNLDGSTNIAFIRLTKAENFNFTMLCIKLKCKKAFLTDVLFNENFPSENVDQIRELVKLNGIEVIYVEAPTTYATFVRDLINADICSVRGIKSAENNDNRILIESKFIIDKFVVRKEPESAQYKEFIKQVNRYSSLVDQNEVFAPDALSGSCTVLKKVYPELIL